MRRTGFTMVELLLVLAIIVTLASILFPVFARAREQARSNTCRMNLLNIGMALRAYAADHDGLYPPTEDDLSPLTDDYLTTDAVFNCPSRTSSNRFSRPQGVPMGAPANDEIWLGGAGEGAPPGVELAPGMGEPGMAPPPPPPTPGISPGAAPRCGPYPEGTVFTDYYYRAGRRHNELPLAALVADHEPRHNGRANVLMSDGGIKSVTETHWRELGFVTPEEIDRERRPEHWREMDEQAEETMGYPPAPAERGG